MQVFAFLDLEHPAVAWAVMRRMMVSADNASPTPSPGFVSFMQAGMIQCENNARIFNEAIIEVLRTVCFSYRVSRMRGMFFFRSRAEAEARIGDRDWPPYFQPDNLIELDLHISGPPIVVDANWLTSAPIAADGRLNTADLSWIWRYWAGQPFNDSPVWELLANGVAFIVGPGVRRRCLDYVRSVFPDAYLPILMARLAGEVGTRGGQVTPFLLREDDQRVRLGYLWSDAELHDPKVIAEIAAHPEAGCLQRLMADDREWKRPDFRQWGAVYQLGSQAGLGENSAVIPSVHHTGQDQ